MLRKRWLLVLGLLSLLSACDLIDHRYFHDPTLRLQKEDYETFTIGLPDIINKTLKVVLTKTNAIEEIRLVPYTSEAYQNYINYFLDTFIGNNRDDVKIKNQRSLKFSHIF